ncbi:hypothetical protein QCA50_008630 [Cerrena zonata]|uniref:Cytochrome P450 n=1 Tax=Cerrena zonata TaxID=2478898 RepID=A0AAW0G431_9APHY
MSLSLPSQLVVAGVVLWVLSSLYQRFFAPSPLDNLPGPSSNSLLTGNLTDMFNRNAWGFHRRLIHEYGPVSVVRGLFGERMVYVFDPKAMHNIVVKDQYIYEETPVFLNFNRLFFGKGLLSSLGEEHRQQRKTLNPVFNINHMRHMTPLFYETAHRLRKVLLKQVTNGEQEIDMLSWLTRTALELIGQGGLGWSFDKLDSTEPNILAEYLKAFRVSTISFGCLTVIWTDHFLYRPTVSPLFLLMRFMPFFAQIGPAWLRRKAIENVPIDRIKKSIEISDTLVRTVSEILDSKKTALASGDEAVTSQIGEGKDIISILMKSQMAGSEEDRMSDEELKGQMTSLIFAAFETTSGALSHIIHKLSEHQDVQERLRQELIAARDGRDAIPYDELVALPYLEAICRETLRLYSPIATINRRTTQDIVMPLSEPVRGKDGSIFTEVPLPKGTDVAIALLGSNINPAIWGDDAEEWKPERFMKPFARGLSRGSYTRSILQPNDFPRRWTCMHRL